MARMRPRLQAPVLVGVGAAFDFLVGPQAPGPRVDAGRGPRMAVPALAGAGAAAAAVPALQPRFRGRVRAPMAAGTASAQEERQHIALQPPAQLLARVGRDQLAGAVAVFGPRGFGQVERRAQGTRERLRRALGGHEGGRAAARAATPRRARATGS